VPFFLKPITRGIAGKIDASFVRPNYDTHFGFLEQQLATSPNGGDYFCGKELTAADVLISFQLGAAGFLGGIKKEDYPKIFAFLDKVRAREAYQKAIKRVEEETGEKFVGV
jgi:glutathione S-transferase